MKLLLAIALTVGSALAQPAVTYKQVALNCGDDSFLNAMSSGCAQPQIRVTIHPASVNSVAAFVVVVYKSAMFGVTIVQPHVTTTKDEHEDFVVSFPSGDMMEPVISAVEVADLVQAVPVTD